MKRTKFLASLFAAPVALVAAKIEAAEEVLVEKEFEGPYPLLTFKHQKQVQHPPLRDTHFMTRYEDAGNEVTMEWSTDGHLYLVRNGDKANAKLLI